MKLGESGVAYFVEPNFSGEQVPRYLATSPVHDSDLESRINLQPPPPVNINLSSQVLLIIFFNLYFFMFRQKKPQLLV